MVLRTWIVPEPNPSLSLSISNIDYRKLDHDDCRWIYSSAMKKYHKEFSELQNSLKKNNIKKIEDCVTFFVETYTSIIKKNIS